ncbi:MAG: hypothetical protein J4F29_17750, partial [Candidatus Latescibacteria bacterium]|nr:hypothetical protein [Candidatus Latescibacterota bacterium]
WQISQFFLKFERSLPSFFTNFSDGITGYFDSVGICSLNVLTGSSGLGTISGLISGDISR